MVNSKQELVLYSIAGKHAIINTSLLASGQGVPALRPIIKVDSQSASMQVHDLTLHKVVKLDDDRMLVEHSMFEMNYCKRRVISFKEYFGEQIQWPVIVSNVIEHPIHTGNAALFVRHDPKIVFGAQMLRVLFDFDMDEVDYSDENTFKWKPIPGMTPEEEKPLYDKSLREFLERKFNNDDDDDEDKEDEDDETSHEHIVNHPEAPVLDEDDGDLFKPEGLVYGDDMMIEKPKSRGPNN
ncbi:hypothetical protein BN7_6662 [Wickerhamomyces ciferrii]|uniref:Uncharacterized protein n=1 Tax=Wickerhamomyces ciferrii (strain ATCC 14091 / BCRC 22168 / CBS 111 / JCM 3599 / NBRC 0793 / NRRL Y-1031 F-60-10) TaxID=1206466 RepID=K0L0S3_WICCF|nr:uncharacterized protein BN7_6662 [Wickerhamomyces ciferrii]CCH47053.1 hypothetical protein BN7_6662 [Wickerhamomyces ciferrii]